MDFLTMTIRKQKNIALIAHDNKKRELIDWCEANKEILKKHFLCGTGTTARMITEYSDFVLTLRGDFSEEESHVIYDSLNLSSICEAGK